MLHDLNLGTRTTANWKTNQQTLRDRRGSKGPILPRTSTNAGHGIGSPLSERISQITDAYTFLFDQLGVN